MAGTRTHRASVVVLAATCAVLAIVGVIAWQATRADGHDLLVDYELLPAGTYEYRHGEGRRTTHFHSLQSWVRESTLADDSTMLIVRHHDALYVYQPSTGTATVSTVEDEAAPEGWVFDERWLREHVTEAGSLDAVAWHESAREGDRLVPSRIDLPDGSAFRLDSYTEDLDRDPANLAAQLERTESVDLETLD